MIEKSRDCPNCGEPTEFQIQEFGRNWRQASPQRCKNCGWVEVPHEEDFHDDFSILKNHEIRYIKNRYALKIINLLYEDGNSLRRRN